MNGAAGSASRRERVLRAGVGEGLALLSVLAYTAVNALVRTVAGSVDAFAASLTRQLPVLVIAGLAVAVVRPAALASGSAARLSRRDVYLLLAGGVVSFMVGNVLLLQAFAWAGLAASILAVQGGMVVGGAVGSALLLRETPSTWQAVGAGVVCCGLAIAMLPTFGGGTSGWNALVGYAAAFGAGCCYVVANMATRSVQLRQRNTFLASLLLTSAAGAGALAAVCLIRGFAIGGGPLAGMTGDAFLTMLSVGLVNAVAIGAVTLATRYTSVASISTISSLVIVTSMVVAAVAFHEQIPTPLMAGAAFIVAGVVAAQVKTTRNLIAGEENR